MIRPHYPQLTPLPVVTSLMVPRPPKSISQQSPRRPLGSHLESRTTANQGKATNSLLPRGAQNNTALVPSAGIIVSAGYEEVGSDLRKPPLRLPVWHLILHIRSPSSDQTRDAHHQLPKRAPSRWLTNRNLLEGTDSISQRNPTLDNPHPVLTFYRSRASSYHIEPRLVLFLHLVHDPILVLAVIC